MERPNVGGISGRKHLCKGPEASENSYPYLRYTFYSIITNNPKASPLSNSVIFPQVSVELTLRCSVIGKLQMYPAGTPEAEYSIAKMVHSMAGRELQFLDNVTTQTSRKSHATPFLSFHMLDRNR